MCFASTPSYNASSAYVPPQQASEQVDQSVTKARSDQQAKNRAAAGYSSTIKSGSTAGDTSAVSVATKTMTGQ